MAESLIYKRLNANTLLIEWTDKISDKIIEHVLHILQMIETHLQDLIIDCFPAYRSLAISYDPNLTSFESFTQQIRSIINEFPESMENKRICWELPVCYDHSLAPDLHAFAKNKNISPEKIITLHSSPRYKVYFFGFLPGFMYLGGLTNELHCPRKSVPSPNVEAGSVAIGGHQTGIYPSRSPGGWHIIGNCPVPLFNATKDPPSTIHPLDEIIFTPISKEEYIAIKDLAKKEVYPLKNKPNG